jgi:hypothetical protein
LAPPAFRGFEETDAAWRDVDTADAVDE